MLGWESLSVHLTETCEMNSWKQRTTTFPGIDEQIQERFEELFMSLGAPEEMALFCRTTPDFQSEIFLLTPAAASRFASALGGTWEDVDPFDRSWQLLVANGDPEKRFGIRLGMPE